VSSPPRSNNSKISSLFSLSYCQIILTSPVTRELKHCPNFGVLTLWEPREGNRGFTCKLSTTLAILTASFGLFLVIFLDFLSKSLDFTILNILARRFFQKFISIPFFKARSGRFFQSFFQFFGLFWG